MSAHNNQLNFKIMKKFESFSRTNMMIKNTFNLGTFLVN